MGNYIKRLLEDDIIENSKSFPIEKDIGEGGVMLFVWLKI